jgi:hypothetical protein
LDLRGRHISKGVRSSSPGGTGWAPVLLGAGAAACMAVVGGVAAALGGVGFSPSEDRHQYAALERAAGACDGPQPGAWMVVTEEGCWNVKFYAFDTEEQALSASSTIASWYLQRYLLCVTNGCTAGVEIPKTRCPTSPRRPTTWPSQVLFRTGTSAGRVELAGKWHHPPPPRIPVQTDSPRATA